MGLAERNEPTKDSSDNGSFEVSSRKSLRLKACVLRDPTVKPLINPRIAAAGLTNKSRKRGGTAI